tara:strand:- start:4871 stop:6187 length:1317 start_codon:yes stop_codon:yes gene_type:complete
MSKDKKPSKSISEQELLDYLEGKIKGVEANRIERQILSSSFEEEAFEGLSKHSVPEIKEDLLALREKLSQKQIYHKPDYMSIAATVAFLIAAFGSIWFVVYNALPSDQISMKSDQETVKDEMILEADSLANEETSEATIEPMLADNQLPEAEELEEFEEEVVAETVVSDLDIEVDDEDLDDEDASAGDGQLAFNEQQDESFEPEPVAPDEAVTEEEITDQITSAPTEVPTRELAKKSVAATAPARSVTAAEVRSVKGAVYYREDGEPLAGVQVSSGGNRTVSGLNGQFELTGVGVGSTLSFSGQGLISRDVVIENAEPINTVLSPAATSEKVAIIGYDNVVNKSPEPANGRNAFRQYVNTSLQYPEAARSQQIEGVVVLKVTVSSDGSVNNIEVKKSLSASCDEEAVRLIEEGPQWTPATYNGDPVEGSVRVRIIFAL